MSAAGLSLYWVVAAGVNVTPDSSFRKRRQHLLVAGRQSHTLSVTQTPRHQATKKLLANRVVMIKNRRTVSHDSDDVDSGSDSSTREVAIPDGFGEVLREEPEAISAPLVDMREFSKIRSGIGIMTYFVAWGTKMSDCLSSIGVGSKIVLLQNVRVILEPDTTDIL